MIKKLTVLLCLLCIMSCGTTLKYKGLEKVNPSLRHIYSASVSIVKEDGSAVGAGTIVYNKKGGYMVVITAAHVVRGMESRGYNINIRTAYDEQLRKVVVAKIDDKSDLALLRSVSKEKEDGPVAKISSTVPLVGDPVWAIGAPLGSKNTVTNGIISNFEYNSRRNLKLYRTTAPIFYGNSGGGVFNSKGELVCVAHAIQLLHGLIPVPGAGFCVGLNHIKDVL